MSENTKRPIEGRYPYTHAADFIRMIPEKGSLGGVVLSRADASCIRSRIAAVIGMNDEELARKLADEFERITAATADRG